MSEPEMAPTPAPAAAPAPAEKQPAMDVAHEPHWLKPRLERAEEAARAKLLADLGVDDPKKAREAIAAAKRAEDESKTIAERAAEAASAAKSAQKETERLRAITGEHAARMMMVLTDSQQQAVKAIAGDDPAEQLRAISVLGPTWAKEASLAEKPNPATTVPAHSAPSGDSVVSPPDHKSIYSASRERNPFAAAAYGLRHADEVYKPSS